MKKTQKLHMIGNAHLDPVWLWQWQEGFHEVKATFYSALERMKEYDDFIFISSSAAYYEWIEQNDPLMFAEIRRRVQEGRWDLVGGWWIQPDCNLPAGESFARQALYGQRYFKEKFGVTARVGYNVDSFGHHGMLPQLLKQSGLDYYVFMRPSPHEKGLPGRLFWWEADDCSRVLAYRIPYEYCTWGQDVESHMRRVAAELKKPFDDLMCFYGVGNHGGGPTRTNLDSIHRLQQDDKCPQLVFSTPESYFTEIERQKDLPIPVVHDDLQHHASGCYAAHSGVKRWNRQAENLLLAAEKFSVVAMTQVRQPYSPEFGRAWKNVLFNQFHDILAGTSLEVAYEDARNDYGEALAIAGRALNASTQALGWQVNIPFDESCQPLVVFNPNAWPARLPVEQEISSQAPGEALLDPQGQPVALQEVRSQAYAPGRKRICFIADLPALGYAAYRLTSQPQPAGFQALLASETVIENERLRLELDPATGWIKSLHDMDHNMEVFQGPAARPVVLADASDTWGHNVFRFDQLAGEFAEAQVRLLEAGTVKATLRAESAYGNSRLIQDFSLYRGLDWIDVRVTLDWREQHKMLKLRFPLNLVHMRPINEIPYGFIERFANGEEQPGQSWLDVSGFSKDNLDLPYGLSLLNDGKYSFDVNVRDIGLTVLRSPVYANHMPVVADAQDFYAFMDQGVQRFTYRLLPHAGSWEQAGTVQRAAELNQPAVILPATFHPGPLPLSDSFLSVEPANIVVTVLKKAEDNDDLVLRAYETTRAGAHAVLRLPHLNRTIEADFRPCEIKTFRIPADQAQPVVETNFLEWEDQ